MDPYVFGPPGSASESVSHKYGSGSGTIHHQAKIVRKSLISAGDFLNFTSVLDPDPLDRGTDPRIRIGIRIRTKMQRIQNTAFYGTFFKVVCICLNVFYRLLRSRLSAVDVRILADYVRRYNKLGLCSPGDQGGNAKSKCNRLICFLLICKQYQTCRLNANVSKSIARKRH